MAEPEVIKVDPTKMEQMKQTFKEGAEQLQDTLSEMQNIADMLENGALLGKAGTALTDGVRGKLISSINRLNNQFDDCQKKIDRALDDYYTLIRGDQQTFGHGR